MSDKLIPVFTAAAIAKRVTQLGLEVDAVYGQERLAAICVLKGACIFFSDLVRQVRNPELELDFIRLSSYGMNSTSSKHIIFSKDLELDIRGKHVLIVEDIVDSGHTMRFLLDQLSARKPASLRIAALINKFERREADITVDFPGFNIPSGFLVGYGLDFGERYRALPDIYEVVQNNV